MKKILILMLLLGTTAGQVRGSKRFYFPVPLRKVAHGLNAHTHIEVSGLVTYVASERDGDIHFRITDGLHFVICECIYEIPCKKPKVGSMVIVRGISRFDGEHKWYEVHPVEELVLE